MSHSPPFYFIANINITDETEYRKYLDRAGDIFSRYKGSYLAVDDRPELLEGTLVPGRMVLIRFDTREDFEAWYRSEAYQEILKYRLSASRSHTFLIRGKN